MSETKLNTGFCHCLRTRMMFLPDQEPHPHMEGFADEVGHVWCQKTLRVIGPDDRLVSKDTCGPERSCFQGFGPDPAL